jgi:hypothetical protein
LSPNSSKSKPPLTKLKNPIISAFQPLQSLTLTPKLVARELNEKEILKSDLDKIFQRNESQ